MGIPGRIGDRGSFRGDRAQRVGQVRVFESITERECLRWHDSLSGRDGAGHVPEHQAEQPVWGPDGNKGSNPPRCIARAEQPGKRLGEFSVAHRLGRRAVDGTGSLGVFQRQTNDPDDVVDVDPAHPLTALGEKPPPAANRHAGAQLEDRCHDLQGTRARCEHDPRPDDRPPHTGCLDLFRHVLALPANDRQEITARWARLVELFVAARTVETDRRTLHVNLGTRSCLLDRGDDLLRAVDPAVAELALDLRVPSVGEDVVTGQVDDRITAVDLLLPWAGFRRVASDDLIGPHRGIAADVVSIP